MSDTYESDFDALSREEYAALKENTEDLHRSLAQTECQESAEEEEPDTYSLLLLAENTIANLKHFAPPRYAFNTPVEKNLAIIRKALQKMGEDIERKAIEYEIAELTKLLDGSHCQDYPEARLVVEQKIGERKKILAGGAV